MHPRPEDIMATASAIEIKRAHEAAVAAQQLREINERLARIEKAIEIMTAPPAKVERGRTHPVTP